VGGEELTGRCEVTGGSEGPIRLVECRGGVLFVGVEHLCCIGWKIITNPLFKNNTHRRDCEWLAVESGSGGRTFANSINL
jgi:hypothetical protein